MFQVETESKWISGSKSPILIYASRVKWFRHFSLSHFFQPCFWGYWYVDVSRREAKVQHKGSHHFSITNALFLFYTRAASRLGSGNCALWTCVSLLV